MVLACSEECGCTFWRGPNLSNEMKAGHKPCHLPCGGDLVLPVGNITTIGFASRTCARNGVNVPKTMLCFSAVKKAFQASAERMAWTVRSGISKAIDLRRKIPARTLFSSGRARKQVCGLLLEALEVPQHDRIIPNGASATASGARCSR